MANTKSFHLELMDLYTGKALTEGGSYCVCVAGSPKLQAIYDEDGESINLDTSPAQAFTDGKINFKIPAAVEKVDVFIYTQSGFAVQLYNITPGGFIHVNVDTQRHVQTLILPFHPDDYTDAVAKETGFSEVVGVLYEVEQSGVKVTTADATETIDVGNTADPNGIIAAASVANAVTIQLAGALGSGARYVGTASQEFSYTLTAGSDTAAGYIFIHSLIPAVPAIN